MDIELKNQLWNAIYSMLTDHFITITWTDFFKQPQDQLLYIGFDAKRREVRRSYYEMPWYRVYDLAEFICKRGKNQLRLAKRDSRRFIESCNKILEQEVSGYRIIDDNVVPITSQTELNEVEQALQTSMPNAHNHLKRALELLSDRNNPDYSNSIKESISAVEATCRKTVKNDNLTLSQALKEMKKNEKLNLHPSMINAFSNMFGYTSSDSGIRHAVHGNGRDIPFAEAKFFLVACSAFVNYLVTISADYDR